MNRGDVDIFGYNLGGSVSEMMRNPKLERDPLMTEEYIYRDLQLNVKLSDDVFDPDNPAYNYP